ncbi:MAG: maleylacetate reductase [Gammaproteobacteria bacterium]|nr:maleylacetate reductase [Gammaproteobacteria bacterium]
MLEFNYKGLPWNIIFGAGALQRLPEEVEKLGFERALVLTTPQQQSAGEEIMQLLGGRGACLFSEAIMHVPVQTLEAAKSLADEIQADCTVSLGGGSTTGLGKALAAQKSLPNIAIPTSFAGSEMTNIWAVTETDRKVTTRDDSVVPTLTIYDPELTLTMPVGFAMVSGLNALAQAIVNVATDKPNPMVASMALDGIRALVSALPRIKANPDDIEARAEALYGASMAGAALGTGSTGLHHKLCHTFGGIFNTPHAETHAILLAHSVAYNATATAEGSQRIAGVMGVDDAAVGIFDLAGKLDAPQALSDIGIKESDLDEAAAVTTEKPFNNPEPVTIQKVRAMLQRAFEGLPPTST